VQRRPPAKQAGAAADGEWRLTKPSRLWPKP
jgi:hypothetical protein